MTRAIRPHELRVLDATGDTKTTWDADNPDEVAAARGVFDKMRAKGYRAFRVDGDERGARMDVFDPAAGALIMVPQLRGG